MAARAQQSIRPLLALVLWPLVFMGAAWLSAAGGTAPALQAKKTEMIAVIVNEKNPITNLTLDELRAHMKLERQFWPDKKRCEVFLRKSRSVETEILLDVVYRMGAKELRKYWVGKVFRGDISAKPAVVPTAKKAAARVKDVRGGLSVVLASEIPDGVKVLSIDKKKPGDKGYPLVVKGEQSGSAAP